MAFSSPKCPSQRKTDDDDNTSYGVYVGIPQQRIEHHLQFSAKRIYEGKLAQVFEQLKECAEVREDFIDGFPEWRTYREDGITHLNKVVITLDKVHRDVNIAKAVANVGGFGSACAGVGAAVSMLADDPISTPLRMVAGVGNITTSLIEAGADAVESTLSQKLLNTVKKVLLGDLERFEIVLTFFERSRDVTNAIESVCNINVISDVFQQLIAIVPKVRDVSSVLSVQVAEVMKTVSKVLKKDTSNIDIEGIVLLCTSICQNPELLVNIKAILQTLRNAPSMIPMLKMVANIYFEGKFLAEQIYCESRHPVGQSGTSTEAAVMYGLFQAVNIAVGLFSLSVLLEDFQKGSKSRYSPEIQKVNKMLKAELALISHVYKRVKEGNE